MQRDIIISSLPSVIPDITPLRVKGDDYSIIYNVGIMGLVMSSIVMSNTDVVCSRSECQCNVCQVLYYTKYAFVPLICNISVTLLRNYSKQMVRTETVQHERFPIS